jgi:hypothetical protein
MDGFGELCVSQYSKERLSCSSVGPFGRCSSPNARRSLVEHEVIRYVQKLGRIAQKLGKIVFFSKKMVWNCPDHCVLWVPKPETTGFENDPWEPQAPIRRSMASFAWKELWGVGALAVCVCHGGQPVGLKKVSQTGRLFFSLGVRWALKMCLCDSMRFS